ncbi:MAG: hypothetical protein HYX24_05680 [Candidatus Aenigmarchaeota archaeon]|nr:hypothetical protein [Candidatus Aenigmarchaeota archaeon]
MPVNYKAYLDDMLSAIQRIENYTANITYEDFEKNSMAADAVIVVINKLPALKISVEKIGRNH